MTHGVQEGGEVLHPEAKFLKTQERGWAVVAHAFNPSTPEAEAGGS